MSRRTLSRSLAVALAALSTLVFAADCGSGSAGDLGAYRNPSTTEAYLGLGYSWASLKYSQVISANTFGVNNSGGTSYVDLSLAIPLGESGWTLQLHGGRTTYASNTNLGYFFNGSSVTGNNYLFSYTDYKLGIAKEIKGYTLALAYTNADTKSRAADHDVTVYENSFGRNIGESRATFTLAKAFREPAGGDAVAIQIRCA